MVVGIVHPEQQEVQFDFQPVVHSAGDYALSLAIFFAIGFIILTFIAYMQARGVYFEREHPVLALLSLLMTVVAAFWYLSAAFLLIFPHGHQYVVWVPEHEEMTYPINAALGVGWLVASYAWLRFTLRRFTARFAKR
jgi:hypothetical protein